MKRNHEFAHFRVGESDFQLRNISFLISLLFHGLCYPRISSYVASLTRTRSNIDAAFPREEKPVFCTTDNAIAPKACRIGSFFFAGRTFVTLLSHCPYFSRFPSVLICLFQWWGRGFRCVPVDDMQNPCGFAEICRFQVHL